MVKETTIIFMDTSDYMGSRDSPKNLAQLDAMELYIKFILQSHPDHYVGVFGLAGFLSFVVEPTNDISNIMTRVRRHDSIGFGCSTCLERALRRATDPLEDVLKRMVVFIGGPLADPYHSPVFHTPPPKYTMPMYKLHYTQLGARYKEMGVAVDVINFGKQEGFKKHHLCVFLAAVNNNNNARMLDCSGRHHLDASSVLILDGKGRSSSESALLMQGDDFQKAKNQFDEVHGDNFHDLKPQGSNDNTQDQKRKREDKGHDKKREIYGDRGGRKQDDRGNDDTRDRKRKRDDKGHDEGRETYRDRGDRYGRKRDCRGHGEGRERYGDRGDRHDQKQDDTTNCYFQIRLSVDICSNSLIREVRVHDDRRERYRDQDDGYGRKQDDTGHDEGRERYRDRGDGYGRKQDYTAHDEGREIYRDRGGRYGRKRD